MNLYALFFGLALFGFCSCDNDDSVTPDPQARQAFESKYPNATQVEWEKKNNYLIAEFIDNQLDGKAWFDATGRWYMTETELTHTSQLPEAVQKLWQTVNMHNGISTISIVWSVTKPKRFMSSK